MSYFKAVFDTNRALTVKVSEEWDIYEKMSNNPLFDTPPVAYAVFLVALEEQKTAIQNAKFGGIERISIKHSKERVVDDMIRLYRSFATFVAKGDTDIILSSGFRHTKQRASAGKMPKVSAVKRVADDISGQLKLRWKPIDNVGFYEVEARPLDGSEDPTAKIDGDDKSMDEYWESHSTRPASIAILDLKPLMYYAVRIRAKGVKGFGSFSDILVVLVT